MFSLRNTEESVDRLSGVFGDERKNLLAPCTRANAMYSRQEDGQLSSDALRNLSGRFVLYGYTKNALSGYCASLHSRAFFFVSGIKIYCVMKLAA
jgi:hypothetical protein